MDQFTFSILICFLLIIINYIYYDHTKRISKCNREIHIKGREIGIVEDKVDINNEERLTDHLGVKKVEQGKQVAYLTPIDNMVQHNRPTSIPKRIHPVHIDYSREGYRDR